MGGDPIPGPHTPLVEWFQKWKHIHDKKVELGGRHVPIKSKSRRYLHGVRRKRV